MMSRLLLDTHALLWWFAENPAMSNPARKAVSDKANVVMVSAASAWEIATKVRLGRLEIALEVVEHLQDYLEQERFENLPVGIDHAIRAGLLPGPHQDPFDRMLIAQALQENVQIISNEKVFDHYGVTRLW